MRIAHLADVHLGYRAYNRITSQGINCREADVFKAFRQALEKIKTIQPDIVVIAGDLFHVVRPSNLMIQHTFYEFAELRRQIKAPIVIIGGNHDSPRSVDTGCILDLFKQISDVHVVHSDYQALHIGSIDTTVYCLCHRALPELASLKIEPNSETKYNVLTVHGTMEGIARSYYDVGEAISPSKILHDKWDYVALGHYHIHEKIAENAYYSGSLEYTSTNIWEETKKPKGFIEFDLDQHRIVDFHQTKTRDVIELRSIDAEGLTAVEIDKLVEERVSGIRGGHDAKIVRLIVNNIPRATIQDLNYETIRRLRMEALHFQFEPRPKKEGPTVTIDGERKALPLEGEWREFAKYLDIPAGTDRDRLTELGLEYLEQVSE